MATKQENDIWFASPNSGTVKSVLAEIKYGNIWTVLDEVWHFPVFDWIAETAHFHYCQWAWEHRNQEGEEYAEDN